MKRLIQIVAVSTLAFGALVGAPQGASAACGGSYGESHGNGGGDITGAENCPPPPVPDPDPHGGPVDTGPPQPVYRDYYTPACSVNGPPGTMNGDVMCMGAATICDTQGQPDAIYMQHWQKQVYPEQGDWTFVGNVCRGPDDPVQPPPTVTPAMVLDQAGYVAPKPSATVQPGTRSYVNVPNNYVADSPDGDTTVTVLGQQIAVDFTPGEVTWSFGDGATATGNGVRNARVGAPGAVEHAYLGSGSYTITATQTVGVRFTLPDGQTVDLPAAFQMDSAPVTLPVGEIQTRVDRTD